MKIIFKGKITVSASYTYGKIHWKCSFICEPNIAVCGKPLIITSSVSMF